MRSPVERRREERGAQGISARFDNHDSKRELTAGIASGIGAVVQDSASSQLWGATARVPQESRHRGQPVGSAQRRSRGEAVRGIGGHCGGRARLCQHSAWELITTNSNPLSTPPLRPCSASRGRADRRTPARRSARRRRGELRDGAPPLASSPLPEGARWTLRQTGSTPLRQGLARW